MSDFSNRLSKEDEILKGVQVFLQAMGIVCDDEASIRTENFSLQLVKNKIACFMIAELNDQIIANGTLIFQGESCWIGFMGVLPEFQRQGIGTQLFNRLVKEAVHLNFKSIDLFATKKGELLYRKCGFQELYPASLYTILEAPQEIKNVQVKIDNSIHPWIWSLDHKAVGYDRKLYLKSGFQHNAKVLFIKDRGYALLNNDFLGPLIAESSDLALEIIRTAYTHGARRMIVPNHPKISNIFFDTLELEEKEGSQNLRMTYADPLPSNLNYLYAIRSFAGG